MRHEHDVCACIDQLLDQGAHRSQVVSAQPELASRARHGQEAADVHPRKYSVSELVEVLHDRHGGLPWFEGEGYIHPLTKALGVCFGTSQFVQLLVTPGVSRISDRGRSAESFREATAVGDRGRSGESSSEPRAVSGRGWAVGLWWQGQWPRGPESGECRSSHGVQTCGAVKVGETVPSADVEHGIGLCDSPGDWVGKGAQCLGETDLCPTLWAVPAAGESDTGEVHNRLVMAAGRGPADGPAVREDGEANGAPSPDDGGGRR